MNNKLFFVIILILFLICPVMAQEHSGDDQLSISTPTIGNKISLDLKGMDIVDVLKILASRAGINIVVGKNVSGRVTIFLKDVDIWDAFEIILLSNDLAYDKQGDIYNVMTQRDYELSYGERFQDKKQAKIIQLKYAKAADLSRALNQIKTTIGRVVVDEGSNTLALIDTPEKIANMEEFIKNTDLPLKTQVFGLNYAQADKLSIKLQEVITKNVGSIRIDERTNKISVTDYPGKLEEIANLIKAFDEKTPQVLIDAQIVEVSPEKDEFAAGVDWDYWLKKNVRLISSLPAPALTSATTIPNKLAFGVASANTSATVNSQGDYKSIIDLLRIIGKTKILSSPRIMVLNNEEAKILVGTKDAYITSSTSQTGETAITSQTVNFVDVGIKLYVTPTINRDGFITIKIRPEISSSVRTNITSQGQITQVPIVTTSETETTIMVKDGTTIIIAGMKKDKHEKEVRKVPIIGDIPLIGLFFRNKKEETSKTELVIFLTPRIVTGEEPLEYVSLTRDKDIERIQNQAFSDIKQKKDTTDIQSYKNFIFEKIKTASSLGKTNTSSLKGEVALSFVLDSKGQLMGEPRVLSTSDPGLNSLAINSIKESSPFPPFPGDLDKPEENFSVTLDYR